MKRSIVLLVICVFAALAVCTAEDAPKHPAEVAQPKVISAEAKAKFWRARAESLEASRQAEKADATFQGVFSELTKACGDLTLVQGNDGEPVCAQPDKRLVKNEVHPPAKSN